MERSLTDRHLGANVASSPHAVPAPGWPRGNRLSWRPLFKMRPAGSSTHTQGMEKHVSRTPHIEHIRDGDHPLAIILRAEYEPDAIEFLTANDQSLQLGVMRRPRGHVIAPHIHKPVPRTVHHSYEALFIARGRVEVTFFNQRRELVTTRELRQGDSVLLMTGGHGFRVLEDCKMIEVKQGPYTGGDVERFTVDK